MPKLVRRLSSCLLFLTVALFLCLCLTTRPASAEDPRVVASGDLWGFSINSLGEAVWSQHVPGTAFTQIFSSKRGQLTFDGAEHVFPSINNLGDIAWIDGQSLAVLGIIGGKKVTISRGLDGTSFPGAGGRYRTDINDRGEVVWSELNYSAGPATYLVSSLRGRLTDGIIPSDSPSINNQGDVAFRRFVDQDAPVTSYYPQLYKLPAGSTTAVQVTSGSSVISGGAISDNGELVWVASNPEAPFSTEPDRMISDRRGELAQGPSGTLGEVDLNNCGDLLYLQAPADGSAWSLLQIGSAAPCPSVTGNGTRETAAAASLGDALVGAAEAASPVSWYHFEATAGDLFKVRLNYDTRLGPIELALYDAAGNLLSEATPSLPLVVWHKAAYSGSYYVKVTGQGGERIGFAVSFTKLLSCGSGPCPELVADGDVKEGVSVNSLGEAVWVQFDPQSGKDQVFSSLRGPVSSRFTANPSSPAINSSGDMVWLESSGSSWNPWYNIVGVVDGQDVFILLGEKPVTKVDINDRKEIVWDQDGWIYSNRRGRLVSGSKPKINNAGDVFFLAPDPADVSRKQVYKLPANSAVPVAVTSDASDHRSVAAEGGEVLWGEFDSTTSAGRLLSNTRGPLFDGVMGDMDVNSCGEVIFSSVTLQGTTVYRFPSTTPCVSYPGSNTTREQALALNQGDNVTTTVDELSPVRWYRFEGTALQDVFVTVNWGNRAQEELNYTLYDPQGNWQQSSLWQGRTGFFTPYSGTYYLKLESSAGSFPLTVSFSRYSVDCGSGLCPNREATIIFNGAVAINSLGEIAYTGYSGNNIHVHTTKRQRITTEPVEHIGVGLNDLGDLVWVTWDPSSTPALYAVKGLIGGKNVTLTSGAAVIDKADLNDLGEVVWSQLVNGESFVYSNRRGRLVKGSKPSINNSGDITFTRYDGTDEVFKLAAGSALPERLTSDGKRRLSVALAGNEVVSLVEDQSGTGQRITSSTRGVLLSTVKTSDLDVNSCGDVAFVQERLMDGGGMGGVFSLGRTAPCVSHPGTHYTMETAAEVTTGTTFTGVVGQDSKTSWYRFEATAGQALDIRFYSQPMFEHPMQVSIYDAQGNYISGPFPGGSEFTAPATGSYYLKVECQSLNNFNFGFTISLRSKAPTVLKWVAEGEQEWFYASLKESLFHLPAAAELKLLLRDGELSEDVAVNVCEKTVRLVGGYDAGFSAVLGRTRVNGAVKVSCGKLVAEGLVIR